MPGMKFYEISSWETHIFPYKETDGQVLQG